MLKRDIRILEGITHACHLQAGLWPHSVACAATMLNARQMIQSLQGGVYGGPEELFVEGSTFAALATFGANLDEILPFEINTSR